ncbi:MAG: 30S ribosomal protein S20, partial [Bacilli bacterium]|nr:30S ribosomal protein S20 [Bacilli bacterium]
MANIKSEQKRLEVRRRNNERNSAAKSETRTAIKKAEAALAAGNKEEATKLVNEALSLLD